MEFTPDPHQATFIQAVLDPEVDISAMVSGRGGGKSWSACFALKELIYQNPITQKGSKRTWFDNRCTKGVGWCVTIDNKQGDAAEEAFVGVMGLYEEGGCIVKHLIASHAYLLWWPSKNNPKRTFKMEFHSAEREKSLRGRQVDFLWCDESAIFTETIKAKPGGGQERMSPPYLAALKVVLQTGGPVLHTTTPKGRNWFYDWIYVKSLSNPRIKFFGGITTYDNKHLSARAIEMIKDQAPQHDWDQEILGLFKLDPEGLVYPFDDKKNVYPERQILPVGETIAGVDFGYSPDPFCYIWVKKCRKPGGGYRYYVMDELYETKKGIDLLVPIIKNNPLEKSVFGRYADPSRPDSRDYMMRKGMPTWMAKNDWEYGKSIVASYMERGDLLISEKCKNGLAELSIYEIGNNGRPKPKQMDHFCDALRYVLASEEALNITNKNSVTKDLGNGMVQVIEADGSKHIEFVKNAPSPFTPDQKRQMKQMDEQIKTIRQQEAERNNAIRRARAEWKPTEQPTWEDPRG